MENQRFMYEKKKDPFYVQEIWQSIWFFSKVDTSPRHYI